MIPNIFFCFLIIHCHCYIILITIIEIDQLAMNNNILIFSFYERKSIKIFCLKFYHLVFQKLRPLRNLFIERVICVTALFLTPDSLCKNKPESFIQHVFCNSFFLCQ